MHWISRYIRWLEQHWTRPTYGGGVILGLTACFWLAAANTLAGWLYVLSGTCLALLFVAAWLPMRSLQGITAKRSPLYSVSVGESLSLTVVLERHNSKSSLLLQVQDQLPSTFKKLPWYTIEWSTQQPYRWTYSVSPQARGYYQWKILKLKTGTPLGLFSSQRHRICPASVLVYPEILPLTRCPILDEFAAAQARLPDQRHSQQLGQDGTTRSLRPYRHGDARRLIHWRSSAKFNELRTRELEVIAGDSPVTIALNSGDRWSHDAFESAVTAAASLFHYAQQQGLSVQLWTARSGALQQDISVLETLALVESGEDEQFTLPTLPVLWLTESPQSLSNLPQDSRVIFWQSQQNSADYELQKVDIVINPHHELVNQLQQGLTRRSL